jgi:general secretion pathway protein D
MFSYKYFFLLALIAASQAATAQNAAPAPASPPASAPATSAPAPVSATVPASASTSAHDAQPAAAKSDDEQAGDDAADPPAAEPRVLRGSDKVNAPVPDIPPLTGAPIGFNFEEAPIAEVVRTILGDLLKVDYVLHPPINGSVTLATREPVSPDKAVFLLESALAVNGLTLVRDVRGTYHVGQADAVRKSVSTGIRQLNTANLPPGAGPIIVPLRYIGAGEMAAILRPMLPTADSIVRVDTVRNMLILVGTRTQAEGWQEIINTFDVDLLKGMSVGVFPLKYASVDEVQAALQLLGGSGGGGSAGAATPGRPGAAPVRPGAAGAAPAAQGSGGAAGLGEGNPLFGALRIMPIERMNSILIVTPRADYLEEARRWIERFDRPSDGSGEPQLFIYRVQNGNADHLASVLQGIFGGGPSGGTMSSSGVAPGMSTATGTSRLGQNGGFGNSFGGGGFGNSFGGGGFGGGFGNSFGGGGFGNSFGGGGFGNSFGTRSLGQGGFGGSTVGGLSQQGGPGGTGGQSVSASIGNVRVMADDLNNTILVWGTRAEFRKIEATLKRLDLPPAQVLIEASIIEVTLNNDLSYGLQWAFSGGVGHNGAQGAGLVGPGRVVANTGSLTDVNAAGATGGFSYSLVNSLGQIRMALTALADKTTVKMISNPSLMVLDNHTAMMSVGNQVPIQTSITNYLTTTDATTSTVQYLSTGVNLAVTPSINAGNLVTMQIDQTVTDTAGTPPAGSQPTFLQRQISSIVAVRSGESIVLGGLIRDTQSTGKSGVPLLQDVPVVGNLFSNNTNTGARTELLVVITPKVVRSDIDVREVSEELRDRLQGLREVLSEKQPSGKEAPAPATPQIVQPLPAQ